MQREQENGVAASANSGPDAADDEDQQWKTIIRMRRKDCRRYNIPIFITRQMVAQLRNPNVSWRERRAILTRIQEGTREIDQRRESEEQAASGEASSDAPPAAAADGFRQQADRVKEHHLWLETILDDGYKGDRLEFPHGGLSLTGEDHKLKQEELLFVTDKDGFRPLPWTPMVLQRVNRRNTRCAFRCLLCDKGAITDRSVLLHHQKTVHSTAEDRETITRAMHFSGIRRQCKLCKEDEVGPTHWATQLHRRGLEDTRAMAKDHGFIRVFRREPWGLTYQWGCVPCQRLGISPWDHCKDTLHNTCLTSWKTKRGLKLSVGNHTAANSRGYSTAVSHTASLCSSTDTASPYSYAPKFELHALYAQRGTGLSSCFYQTWQNNVSRWTAALVCPVTSEVYLSAPYAGVTNVEPVDSSGNCYWFTKKSHAEHAVAAIAYDCWMLRDHVASPKRLSLAKAYEQSRFNLPASAPRAVSRAIEGIQRKIKRSQQKANSTRPAKKLKSSTKPPTAPTFAAQSTMPRAKPSSLKDPLEASGILLVKNANPEHIRMQLSGDPGSPKTRFSGLRETRPEASVQFFERLVKPADIVNRIEKYDPFWKVKNVLAVALTSTVANVQPHTASLKSALQHSLVVPSFVESLIPIEHWGSSRSFEDGDHSLLLRMFPLKVPLTRCDYHRWPSGTFLQINGSPVAVKQPDQCSHELSQWSGLSEPLHLCQHLSKSRKDLLLEMGTADSKSYILTVTLCSYRSPAVLFRTMGVPCSSLDEGTQKAVAFARDHAAVCIDDDEHGMDSSSGNGLFVISLTCPMSRQRIKTPVRGHQCSHFQVSMRCIWYCML